MVDWVVYTHKLDERKCTGEKIDEGYTGVRWLGTLEGDLDSATRRRRR